MSIILEALKKVTKESPVESVEIEKIYEVPEPELKKPEPQTPGFSAPRLTKPTLISVAIILVGGFLLFFLLKGRDVPITKNVEPGAQPTSLTLTEKTAPIAEGYAPPQPAQKQKSASVNIFKIKVPNPRLALNGIVSGIGKPTAIIDNKIVEEGASISGAKVVKIYNDRVELRNEASGEIFTLRVY